MVEPQTKHRKDQATEHTEKKDRTGAHRSPLDKVDHHWKSHLCDLCDLCGSTELDLNSIARLLDQSTYRTSRPRSSIVTVHHVRSRSSPTSGHGTALFIIESRNRNSSGCPTEENNCGDSSRRMS